MIASGSCGYSRYDAGPDWRQTYDSKLQAYAEAFRTVELNRTFYHLPRPVRARTWRRRTPDDFLFCMKAWMALTHPNASPVWNDRREQVSEEIRKGMGDLRDTHSNRLAWKQTRQIAEILEAEVVLLQCRPSFGPTDDNVAGMHDLLSDIDRRGLQLAWEPRGDWRDERALAADLADQLDLILASDPLRAELRSDPLPRTDGDQYIRLHGLNDELYDYSYDYDDQQLRRLAEIIQQTTPSDRRSFVMFNNDQKFANATRFRQLLDDG
jgi:uncharacterized protein YecE (DUF72 family)